MATLFEMNAELEHLFAMAVDPETGEIRTEGLPDSAYEIFTILHEIYDNESRDIIQDFFPDL